MKFLFCILSVFFCYLPLLPIVIGSDSAVSRNSFFTFPNTDTDNAMEGFCYMDGGFALQDYTTTCTFNGLFPVRQNIFLNNGYLSLSTNLTLDNVLSFTSLGNISSIDTNQRKLDLADNTGEVGAATISPVIFTNIDMGLRKDMTCYGTIHFDKDCRILGNGHLLTLDSSANFIVDPGSQLKLENMTILGTQGKNISCADNSASLILDNVTWLQTNSFTFDTGSILFLDQVTFSGTGTFAYSSAYTSTIASKAAWKFAEGIGLQIGKSAVSGAQPLYFTDATSSINFVNCSFAVTNQGMQFTNGLMSFDGYVSFSFASTSTMTGLIIGTGDPSQDFTVRFTPAAVLNFMAGHFTYNDSTPNGFVSLAKTARFIRNPGTTVYLAQNFTLSNATLVASVAFAPTVIINTGKSFVLSGVSAEVVSLLIDITAQQIGAASYLLRGTGDFIAVSKGIFSPAVTVQSTGSVISGNDVIAGSVTLTNAATSLTWGNVGQLNSAMTFNNGAITLASNLSLLNSGRLVGPGTINLVSNALNFQPFSITQTTPLSFVGPGTINIHANYTLQTTFTVSNNCTINGNSFVVDITNGAIVIEPSSQLVLKNMVLNGVQGSNIYCIDNTGSLVFDNVRLILDNYFTFTLGGIQFKNTNKIQGIDQTFAYQSMMTSTILANSKLNFDPNMTFSFDPPLFDGCNDLIQFIDDSSELVLNGASLVTTTSGIELTTGTLRVKRTSYISSSAQIDLNSQRGISFGNGTTDINIVVAPHAQLYLLQGILEYRNLSDFSLIMLDDLSAIRIAGGALLQLFADLDIQPGFVVFDDGAALFTTDGSQIIGSINPQGALVRGQF